MNTFREDEKVEKETLKINTLFRLYAYLLKFRKEIIIVLALMALTIIVKVVNPLLIQKGIDNFIDTDSPSVNGLIIIGVCAVIINAISWICVRKRTLIISKVSNRILMNIRQELYTHIQSLGFEFFDNRPVGKILARIIGDVNSLKEVLQNSVISLIPDFITVIAVAVIMIVIDWRLGLAALASLPVMVLGMWFVQIRSHKRWQMVKKKNSNMNAFTNEDFSGIRVVQSFAAEDDTNKTFDGILVQHKDAFIKAVRLNDLFWSMTELSWGVGTVLVYIIGVNLYKSGEVSIGMLVAFTTYIGLFWGPIMNLSNLYNQLITNVAGAERIFEIMDIEPEIKDSKEAKELPNIHGEVEFRNITFGYEEDIKVLEDVSFKIKPGETIALVGPTGAGKTTIVNLISRFYEAQKGEILIDGHNIYEVTVESLRGQMGIMTQDNFLFSGTIKENIKYGKLDATDEEVVEAAKAVHANEFIMQLENGYDTQINERGTRLSIGQRQLVAFARTMISKPRILILDEATSNIDTHTERYVQQGIEELLTGRTSFVIAHRLSTIQKADRIFVVDQGNILEQGSHAELLAKKGIYYGLYMAQFDQSAIL
ncbi:MAG: yknV [Clostridiales bacterium]|nr:yknV [Clostridiales bacterium]